jgi:iron complex outermembrane recepter protein
MRTTLLTCASVWALAAATGGHAQERPDAGSKPVTAKSTSVTEAAGGMVGEVVVTAQKREQNLQDVPASVAVVSQENLLRSGIKDQSELTKLVPGLTIGRQSTTGFVYIRGVGQAVGSPNLQPAVAVNINGVYLPREAGLTPLFDMERIEVLPGPQGTLWGRNAAGGAINFVTARPSKDFGGFASVEVGNYSQLQLTGALNVPLSDRAAIRVAADHIEHDPWSESGLGDYKTTSVRGALSAELTNRLSVNLFGQYVRRDDTAPVTFLYSRANPPADFFNPPPATRIPDNLIPLLKQNTKLYVVSAEISYDLGHDVTLTILPGYIDFKSDSIIPFSAVSPSYFGNNVKQKSFEARIAKEGGRFNWLGGVYYSDADSGLPVNPAINALGNPRPTRLEFGNEVKSYAVFGEVTYSITDQLRLTGGARYSNDRFAGFFRNGLAGINTGVVSGENDNVDWKAQVEFDVAPNNMVYGAVQTGYIMGGFNANPTGSPVYPEKLIAYAVGSKNQFFERALTLNVEAFYYDYDNYHLQAVSGTPQNPLFDTFETPAKVMGIEVVANVRLGKNDRLTLSGLIQRAEIQTNTLRSPWTGASQNGARLPNAPDETFRASWDHEFPLNGGGSVVSNAQVYSSSGYSQDATHHPNTYQGSYALFDASLAYHPPSDRWSITAYAQNITDEAIMTGAITPSTLAAPATPFLQAPRTYGVRVNLKY